MSKNKLLLMLAVFLLIITPVIVYAVARTKTVTNNISMSISGENSKENSTRYNLSILFNAGFSNEFFTRNLVSITCLAFDSGTLTSNHTITSYPATGNGYVLVDGSDITTPDVYTWNKGDFYDLGAYNYVDIVTGESRYHFSSWSDGGIANHTIIVPLNNSTFTAYFDIEYKLDVIDGSGINWYLDGVNSTSSAFYVKDLIYGQSRSNLISYTLDGSTTNLARNNTGNSSLIIDMSSHHSLVWNYITQYYCNISSAISDLSVSQSGSQTSDNWYDSNTNAVISTVSPQTNIGISYEFTNWVWYLGGIQQANSTTNPYTLNMNNYSQFIAYWIVPTFGVDINIDGNATITVDGISITTPDTLHFNDGSTHNIIALYYGLFINPILNVIGNATITLDGFPVTTPDSFAFASGSNHTLTAYGFGGISSGGGLSTGLFIGIFLIFMLVVFIMATRKRR